jgi:hopanoid biosynthesis associated protein HpnK
MSTVKAVIINADDFGLSASVNRGIIEAHRGGVVTSATLLANMPGFEEAVRLSSENPGLGVGVHLNVVRGRPVSPPESVPTLVSASGDFLGAAWALAARVVRGAVAAADLEREFSAQIRRVMDAGVAPTHVDSEKHAHAVPPVFRAAVKSARVAGIQAIRFPAESPELVRRLPRVSQPMLGRVKSRIIRTLTHRNRDELGSAGLSTTDHFFGIAAQAELNSDALCALADALPPGVCEVTCHPGYVDQDLLAISERVGGYWINRVREKELAALTSPEVRDSFARNHVTLLNFKGLLAMRDVG